MLRKLERAGLQADLADVSALLGEIRADDDPIGYSQFTERRREIEQALVTLGEATDETGKVALLFGGRPVWGSRGIDAEFASHAIDTFQRAVAAQTASASGPVGTRGRLSQDAVPQLLVTEIGRGSFGFVFEEGVEHGQLVESPMRHALDQIAHAMRGVAASDEESFNSAIDAIEPRALKALAEFFAQLHESGAEVRLIEGEEDFVLDAQAINRAKGRTEQIQIDEETIEEDGVLVGLVPQRRSFEWKRLNGETIVGTTQGDIARTYEQRLFDDHPMIGALRARFRVRRVSRRGVAPHFAYTLLQVEPRR